MSNKAQHKYTLNLGDCTGPFIINYDASNGSDPAVPVRFSVEWNGSRTTSGFVGDPKFNSKLTALGFPPVNNFPLNNPVGSISVNKNLASPPTAELTIDSPLEGGLWTLGESCNFTCPTTTTTLSPTTTTTTTTTTAGAATTPPPVTSTPAPPCVPCPPAGGGGPVAGGPFNDNDNPDKSSIIHDINTWGGNSSGQVGNGRNNDVLSPTFIGTAYSPMISSAGNAHSSLLSNGTLFLWGSNIKGQLGNNQQIDSNSPDVTVVLPKEFLYSSMGVRSSFGIDKSGVLYSWGENNNGILGDGTKNSSSVPVKISRVETKFGYTNSPSWKIVAASRHALAIDKSGRLFGWGLNTDGQVGKIITPVTTTTPSPAGMCSSSGAKHWVGITMSSDGSKIAATEDRSELLIGGTLTPQDNYVYTSIDQGINWSKNTSSAAGVWGLIAGSSDGSKLAAIGVRASADPLNPDGGIHTSVDGGANWTLSSAFEQNYTGICCSDDGTKLAACTYFGYIYTSSDGGVNWIERNDSGSRSWSGISSSGDGDKLAAVELGGYVYTSVDGGANWSAKTSLGINYWSGVDISDDGNTIVAASYSPPDSLVNDGYIYISVDGGLNWTKKTTSMGSKYWKDVTISSDGTKLAAISNYDSTIATNKSGYIYVSVNGGNNWTKRTFSGEKEWVKITSSSDGSKIAAITENSYIYTTACEIASPATTTTAATTTPAATTTQPPVLEDYVLNPWLIDSGVSGKWKTVSAGGSHSMGLKYKTVGAKNILELYCWGDNFYGQIGDGTYIKSNNPIKISHPSGGSWASISAGINHSMALDDLGNLYIWGDNKFGQLGLPASVFNKNSPTLATSSTKFTRVSGSDHTLAVDGLKNLYCWGRNDFGQLGDGTKNNNNLIKINASLKDVYDVSAGWYHSLAITKYTTTTTTVGPTTTARPGGSSGTSIPCCPEEGELVTNGEIHIFYGGSGPSSPVIYDDNYGGDYWSIEWYEVDENDGIHAWVTKRKTPCLFPGTNAMVQVLRIGNPQGLVLKSTGRLDWSQRCHPDCPPKDADGKEIIDPERYFGLGINSNLKVEALKKLKGFGGKHWSHIQFLAGLNGDFPKSGVIGPMGAGAGGAGFVSGSDYQTAVTGYAMPLMGNQPGAGFEAAFSTIRNYSCLKARLGGRSCDGQGPIDFHLTPEEIEFRKSLYPVAKKADPAPECCDMNDVDLGKFQQKKNSNECEEPTTTLPPCGGDIFISCYYQVDGYTVCQSLTPADCEIIYNGRINCDPCDESTTTTVSPPPPTTTTTTTTTPPGTTTTTTTTTPPPTTTTTTTPPTTTTIEPTTTAGPCYQDCGQGYCPECGWVCCPGGEYCAATIEECPDSPTTPPPVPQETE